jgi:hypothetical protein
VFAVKDKEVIIVELKLQITLKLIYQALERKKVTPLVYIGVPKRILTTHQKNNSQFVILLKKLGLGLMEVTLDKANILIEPSDDNQVVTRHSSAKKRVMMKEFDARDQYQTLGGTNQKKMTAYREKVVEIGKALHVLKAASVKLVKEYTRIEKSADILRNNYDGWFIKNEKGLYQLSPLGLNEIEKHLF